MRTYCELELRPAVRYLVTRLSQLLCLVAAFTMLSVLGLTSCAGLADGERSLRLDVVGPLYGYVESTHETVGYAIPGADAVGALRYEFGVHTYDLGLGSYTARFTVMAPGPAVVTVAFVREAGIGWFAGEDEIKGRAVFVVDAPVGAKVRLAAESDQHPGDLRLEIDHDADGQPDDEVSPDLVKTGDDISSSRDFQTDATIDQRAANEALVSFATQGDERVQHTYYWLFPHDPTPYEYDEPLVLKEPSYLLFASLDRDGNLEAVQDVRVLGGAPDITGAVAFDEERVIDFDEPGRVATLTFAGRQGQRVVPKVTASNLGPFPCCSGGMRVLAHDGTTVVQRAQIGARPVAMDTIVLPSDGDYTLVVDPYLAYTGEMTVVVEMLKDVKAIASVDGPELTVDFEHLEQRGEIQFDGRTGQQVSIVVRRPEASRCCRTNVTVVSPSGTGLATGQIRPSYNDVVTLRVALPLDGTYRIDLDPHVSYEGSLTVAIHAVSDVEAGLTLDGAPEKVRFTAPGQTARLTFRGSAGQQVYISALDAVANDAYNSWAYVDRRTGLTVLSHDETAELVRAWLSPRGESAISLVLPSDGDYTILVDPFDDATGLLEIELLSTAPESRRLAAEPWPAESTSTTIVLDDPQLRVQRSFSGSEGQLIMLQIDQVMTSGSRISRAFWPRIIGPDGVEPGYDSGIELDVFGFAGLEAPLRLPATGTYVIDIESYEHVATGSFRISLFPVDDLSVRATVGGPPVSIETTYPAQFARVTFLGQAGPLDVALSMPEQGRELDGNVNYTIAGAEHENGWGAGWVHQGSSKSERWTLSSDGQYAILFEPRHAATFSVTVTLSRPRMTEPTAVPLPPTLMIDGPPARITLPRSAEPTEVRLSFEGKAGQHVQIEATLSHEMITVPGSSAGELNLDYELVVEPASGEELAKAAREGNTLSLEVSLAVSGEYGLRLRALGNSKGRWEISAHQIN